MSETVMTGWQMARQSFTFRFLLIVLLTCLLAVPLWGIQQLLTQRENQQYTTQHSLMQQWGGSQTLLGPILVLPYTEHISSVDTITEGNGESRVVSRDIYTDHTALILPALLNLEIHFNEDQLQQQQTKAQVYEATVQLAGRFDYGMITENEDSKRDIHWDQAYLSIGLTDTRFLKDNSNLQWGNEQSLLQPSSRLGQYIPAGLHAPLPALDAEDAAQEFKLSLTFKGSEFLAFAPTGEITTATLTATSQTPHLQALHFNSLLPKNQTATDQRIKAQWEITDLVREYPQYWLLEDKHDYNLQTVLAQIGLAQQHEPYTTFSQLFAYAPLLIFLLLVALYALQPLAHRQLSTLQWLVVGLSVPLFYLILMALLERQPLVVAYGLAAGVCIFLASLYTWLSLGRFWLAFVFALWQIALYYSLYLSLQHPTERLLGSVAFLIIAFVLMIFATFRSTLKPASPVLEPASTPPTESENNTEYV